MRFFNAKHKKKILGLKKEVPEKVSKKKSKAVLKTETLPVNFTDVETNQIILMAAKEFFDIYFTHTKSLPPEMLGCISNLSLKSGNEMSLNA